MPDKPAYRFAGKTIMLVERDYDKWRKAYHAIPDFDAELQRIDDEDLPLRWFPAVSAKLAAKHQKLLGHAPRRKLPPSEASIDVYADLIKRAAAENKRWMATKNISIIAEAYRKGLITADEADFCGYRP